MEGVVRDKDTQYTPRASTDSDSTLRVKTVDVYSCVTHSLSVVKARHCTVPYCTESRGDLCLRLCRVLYNKAPRTTTRPFYGHGQGVARD